MKTRIVVREYNDGRKEFECQQKLEITEETFGVVFLYIIPVFWPFLSQILWTPMFLEKNLWNDKKSWSKAIFNKLEEAKEFINAEIQKDVDNKFNVYQQQVKKTYKVKYP